MDSSVVNKGGLEQYKRARRPYIDYFLESKYPRNVNVDQANIQKVLIVTEHLCVRIKKCQHANPFIKVNHKKVKQL